MTWQVLVALLVIGALVGAAWAYFRRRREPPYGKSVSDLVRERDEPGGPRESR